MERVFGKTTLIYYSSLTSLVDPKGSIEVRGTWGLKVFLLLKLVFWVSQIKGLVATNILGATYK